MSMSSPVSPVWYLAAKSSFYPTGPTNYSDMYSGGQKQTARKKYGLMLERCYCGNKISAKSKRVADAMCNNVCMADFSHYCGGKLKLGLYERDEPEGEIATS